MQAGEPCNSLVEEFMGSLRDLLEMAQDWGAAHAVVVALPLPLLAAGAVVARVVRQWFLFRLYGKALDKVSGERVPELMATLRCTALGRNGNNPKKPAEARRSGMASASSRSVSSRADTTESTLPTSDPDECA
jgi:hypothetical protein